jgi:hypothetical protein
MTETELRIFELHNVWLKGDRALSTAPRCEHCARITRSVAVTQSMFVAEGGRVGEVSVPQRGLVKRAGTAKSEPVTTVNGSIGSGRGGGTGVGAAVGGLLTGAAMLAEPMIKKWFAENYLKKKWAAHAQAMVQESIRANLWRFNFLIVAHRSDIDKAVAAGRQARLHVCVDTEWVHTDFGPAQTKAAVSYYDLFFGDDMPLEWPVFQPKHWFGPRITRRRECFDFVLA